MAGLTNLRGLANLAPGDGKGAYGRANADEIPMDEVGEPKRDGSKSPRGGSWKRGRSSKPFLVLLGVFVLATAVSFVAVNLGTGTSLLPDSSAGKGTVRIEKSPSDNREYKFFTMPSGLQVIVVSDPTADRAAASMDVSVGSFSDPLEFPGLAHFLEHMLFMGSRKYPDENQYSAFLAQHGGSSNAYTAAEDTNYHFDITPDHFAEALDVFAQFFISPLLSEGSTEREVNAVENEHIKNLQSDGWRAQQLRKSLSNPKHPMHKFGTGNLDTLCNNTRTGTSKTHCHGTRKALLKFYNEHYSPERMRLAVLSKQPIGDLENLVKKSFGMMAARGHVNPPQWNTPVRPAVGPRMVHYVPIRDQRQLSLTWDMPPLFTHFKSKAGSYISHLIGHEAEGSLAALLKQRGLVESLSSGASTDQRYGASFDISMSLTEQGLQQKDLVLDLLFQYIRLVRNAGALQWVWKESADLAAMHFRFQEKRDPSGYVVSLASNMQLYPPQYVISAPYTYGKFDGGLIRWILTQLTPEKADIYIAAPRFKDIVDKKEAVYGTPYSLKMVDQETLKTWSSSKIDPAMHLVRPNMFIPRNFTMVALPAKHSTAANRSAPVLLVDRPGARLWWKQDYDFKAKNWKAQPKVNVMFQITAPYSDVTARSAVLTTLWTMLYNDALVETTYDAGVAGLSWGLSPSADGLRISVGGYNDKLLLLLKQVTDPMVTCLRENSQCMWAKAKRFEVIKDELRRGLENSKKMSPYSRAMERMSHLLQKRVWSTDRLMYELSLPSMDLDAVAEHAKEMLARTHMEGFVHGNADADMARACLQQVSTALASFPLPGTEREVQEIVKLDAGLLYADAHTNPDDLNHALELYYQVPHTGIRQDVKTALLGEMMREPCFNQLRTQEQLGYIVACRSRPIMPSYPPAVDGLSILVQSSFKDPAALDMSAQRFVGDFLSNMSSTEPAVAKEQLSSFEAHKQSLLAEIQEKETTVSQETGRLWKEIMTRRYQWYRRDLLKAAVQPLTLDELIAFARDTLQIQKHSLAVWIYGKGMAIPEDSTLIPLEQRQDRSRIHSVASFKRAPPTYFPISYPTTEAKTASATAPRSY